MNDAVASVHLLPRIERSQPPWFEAARLGQRIAQRLRAEAGDQAESSWGRVLGFFDRQWAQVQSLPATRGPQALDTVGAVADAHRRRTHAAVAGRHGRRARRLRCRLRRTAPAWRVAAHLGPVLLARGARRRTSGAAAAAAAQRPAASGLGAMRGRRAAARTLPSTCRWPVERAERHSPPGPPAWRRCPARAAATSPTTGCCSRGRRRHSPFYAASVRPCACCAACKGRCCACARCRSLRTAVAWSLIAAPITNRRNWRRCWRNAAC